MTPQMHTTLERYFAATNRHDVAGMIADFADDAVVKDEGHEHRGVPAHPRVDEGDDSEVQVQGRADTGSA